MKKYWIIGIVLIIILGVLIIPKALKGKNGTVSFKTLDMEELPAEIREALPKYIMEERALTFKYKDEIFVIVTRGEKKTRGYFVDIDKIVKEPNEDETFDLVVYAKFIDPSPNEIVSQEYEYPVIVVKTNLKAMPQDIHLDIEYVD